MPPQRFSQTEVRDKFPLIPASDSVEKESSTVRAARTVLVARVFCGIPFSGELAIEQNAFLEYDDLDAVQFSGIAHLFDQMQGEVFPDVEMLFFV